MKTVHEVLGHKPTDQVYSITPIESVFEAIEQMADRHVGALPVLQDNKLVGIISERDYARKVILKDKSSKQTKVSEIMTQSVVTVTPHNTVDECVNLMQSNHIRHLVVEDEGVVSGMLSLRDLFNEIIEEQAETIVQLEHYIRGDQ